MKELAGLELTQLWLLGSKLNWLGQDRQLMC
jgi:hypothetical protein